MKSEYSMSIKVEALFATNVAIYALQEGWTSFFLLGLLRKAIYTKKI